MPLVLRYTWPVMLLLLLALTAPLLSGASSTSQPASPTVRVCVIGGMTMTGLWQELARRFEQHSGYRVELVATGPRTVISAPFRRGEADFLVMHSGDITTDLVADGYGINMRPCARNDLVIVGPPTDPAGIRGLDDGGLALRRIAEAQVNFVDVNSNGARELGHTLWQRAGIRPSGEWFLQDEAAFSSEVLSFAASHHAYAIFGRMPLILNKVEYQGLEILVADDPSMRRPYLLMEANPARFPQVNQVAAHALAEYILSPQGQDVIARYGRERNGGKPFFYPVWPYQKGLKKSCSAVL